MAYYLDLIIKSVITYNIKYLLLDSRNSMFEKSREAYKFVIWKFSEDLSHTRLRRLAHVCTASAQEEYGGGLLTRTDEFSFLLESMDFTNRDKALVGLRKMQWR